MRDNIPNLEFYTQQNYYSETKEKRKSRRKTLKECTILRIFAKEHVKFAFSKKRNPLLGWRLEKQVARASRGAGAHMGKSKWVLAIHDNDDIRKMIIIRTGNSKSVSNFNTG